MTMTRSDVENFSKDCSYCMEPLTPRELCVEKNGKLFCCVECFDMWLKHRRSGWPAISPDVRFRRVKAERRHNLVYPEDV